MVFAFAVLMMAGITVCQAQNSTTQFFCMTNSTAVGDVPTSTEAATFQDGSSVSFEAVAYELPFSPTPTTIGQNTVGVGAGKAYLMHAVIYARTTQNLQNVASSLSQAAAFGQCSVAILGNSIVRMDMKLAAVESVELVDRAMGSQSQTDAGPVLRIGIAFGSLLISYPNSDGGSLNSLVGQWQQIENGGNSNTLSPPAVTPAEGAPATQSSGISASPSAGASPQGVSTGGAPAQSSQSIAPPSAPATGPSGASPSNGNQQGGCPASGNWTTSQSGPVAANTGGIASLNGSTQVGPS